MYNVTAHILSSTASDGDWREEVDHLGMKKLTTWVSETESFNRGIFRGLLSQRPVYLAFLLPFSFIASRKR